MAPMPTQSALDATGLSSGSDAADQALVAEVTQSAGPLMELGSTGLKRAGGYLDDEFLPQLRGRKAVQIYREMSDNDPIVGSLVFAIRMLLRNVDWRVEPAGKDKDSAKAAKLVETCMEDMCYDEATEIMAERGWVLFRDLRDDDKVAQRGPDGELTYVLPSARPVYDFDGELLGNHGASVDFLVTPSHRMLFAPRTGRVHDTRQKADLGIHRADEIYNRPGWLSKAVLWNGQESGRSKDWVEFLGFVLADGSVATERAVVLIQRESAYVEDLLLRVGLAERVSRRTVNGSTQWTLHDARLARELAADFGRTSRDKHLPMWLKSTTPAEIESFLTGFIAGDGWESKTGLVGLYTSSKRLADDLQEVAMKAGYAATVLSRTGSPSSFAPGSAQYRVSLWARQEALSPYVKAGRNWYRERYVGKVYCVTVPSGVIMVRRNGKALWSGNSHSWDEMISEALSCVIYGWSWHEIVYKRRMGPWTKDGRHRSKYDDGLIGWRKIPIRSQDTMQRWVFDESGGTQGMVQLAPPTYKTVVLPMERSLLFRFGQQKNNPEGRALDPATPIPTPDGWRRMDSLVAGSRVFDEIGAVRHVVARADWADRPRYLVTFNDGTEIVADAEHQWLVSSSQRKDWGTHLRTTAELASETRYSWRIRRTAPIDYVAQRLLIDPYVFGVWLGDGDSNGARISCHADDLAEEMAAVEARGYEVTKAGQNGTGLGRYFRIGSGMQADLGRLGVQGDKHIPPEYLMASIAQRRALLAGLLDTDGHVDSWGRVEFVNVNRALIDGVAELARSLGLDARVGLRRTALASDECGKSRRETWAVRFTPTEPVFGLERKNAKIRPERVRAGHHHIRSVEPVENGATVCIEVDSPSHLFLAGQSMVPTHNSALRNAYRPWYYKKRLEEIEAVGVERDLAGLPMVSVPASFLKAKPGTDQHKQVQAFQKMVRSIRRDEQEGLVFPIEYDQDTKQPLYKFELLTSGGGRAFNTGDIIKRYEERMLMTVLADFILVGHQDTGTYNMHLDKTGMFKTALNAVTDSIADVFNRHAVPRLFSINGWKPSELPKIVAGDVDAPDLGQLSQFLTSTAGLGFTWGPDADLERFLRQAAGLPELNDDDEARRRTMARRDEASRMAQSQTMLLQSKAELMAAKMQAEAAAAGEMLMDPETQAAEQEMAGAAQQQELAGAEGEQKLAHTEESHQMDMAARQQQMRQAQDKGKIDAKSAATKEKLSLAAAKGARDGQKGRKK